MKPTTLNLTTREVLGSEVVTVDYKIVKIYNKIKWPRMSKATKKAMLEDIIKQITT